MRKRPVVLLLGCLLLFAAAWLIGIGPAHQYSVFAQGNSDPAGEHNCPSVTGAGGGAEAQPAFVGSGTGVFSPNQSLCLPELAPVGGPLGPLAFIVQGGEPGDRVDSQGNVIVESIRGVPGGTDLWRWYQPIDGAPNANGTLPFKYEGQPDNCGVESNGCVNNVGSMTNYGVAPGGGDCDIAVNGPDPTNSNIPNIPFVSLSAANVTAAHSTNRGDSFSLFTNVANLNNPIIAVIPGDDRMWLDAYNDASTVYMNYHDLATFNIDVQRSADGGSTYISGIGEAIDANTLPAAGSIAPTDSANVAGQIRIDKNTNMCSSLGNLYQIFVAPDNVTENTDSGPLRTAYVGVSTDARNIVGGVQNPAFTFTDYKIYTTPEGQPGATNGLDNLFPATATDNNGFVYAAWSDNTNIWFASSSNQGESWSAPLQVNEGSTVGNSNLFPWIAADADGHVVVAWYGANKAGESNDPNAMEAGATGGGTACSDGTNNCWAAWNVYLAESVNANSLCPANCPAFTQNTASDHFIHHGTICTEGTNCSGSDTRGLLDFFQLALDPQHRANITYADDHLHATVCTTQTPGHCADDDPATYRVANPYFTYQLKANPNVVLPSTSPSTCFLSVSQSGGGGQSCTIGSSNTANFNGTAVPGGDTIWFNSNFQVSGQGTSGATVQFTNGSISFTANGASYNLAVPNATITFSPSATCGSTTYSGAWQTTVPVSGSDEIFLTGLAFQVPPGGLPGGIQNVTWTGTITTAQPGLSIKWKWGAAVYTSFTTNYNSLGVKSMHQSDCTYNNSDHAGTPENYEHYVTGGATGGGGSNYTGSWSGTLSAFPDCRH